MGILGFLKLGGIFGGIPPIPVIGIFWFPIRGVSCGLTPGAIVAAAAAVCACIKCHAK